MFVKIPIGTDLYDICTELSNRMFEYDKAAFEWAKFQGATEIRAGWFDIAGGISTATFPNKPPKGWRKAGPKFDDNEYEPGRTVAGREVRKAIDGLKKITYTEFNAIFSFDPDRHTTNKRSWHPGFAWYEDCVLMTFADHTPYDLLPDMIEITVTEFNRIQAARKTEES